MPTPGPRGDSDSIADSLQTFGPCSVLSLPHPLGFKVLKELVLPGRWGESGLVRGVGC